MQGVNEQTGTPNGDAAAEQAIAKFAEHSFCCGR
jgi:hypothetical protein